MNLSWTDSADRCNTFWHRPFQNKFQNKSEHIPEQLPGHWVQLSGALVVVCCATPCLLLVAVEVRWRQALLAELEADG